MPKKFGGLAKVCITKIPHFINILMNFGIQDQLFVRFVTKLIIMLPQCGRTIKLQKGL